MGAHAPGQERAPQALRDAGLLERLPDAVDRGDTTHRRWAPDREHRRAQNAAAVVAAAEEVRDQVAAALRDGRRALVLGGDCTVELGVVAAAGPAGLVYFDMHPDLNTPETIPGGTLDWMGVAHLLGLPGTQPDVAAIARIEPQDLVLLAADDEQMTDGERQAIAGLHTVPMAAVAADPAGAAARALAQLPTTACSCTSTSTSSTSPTCRCPRTPATTSACRSPPPAPCWRSCSPTPASRP